MSYSLDLRKRVLDYIEAGGKKSEASRRFSVARSTLYRWLESEDPLTAKKTGPKKMRVIDEEALRKHVADFPDLTQKERAEHFGVAASTIRYGLRKLGITLKKKETGYKQRCDKKRATYRKELKRKETEGKSAAYVDECGFRKESFRPYAYAPKGESVLGLISSQQYRATSMIAARIEGVFTAHSLFEGSCNGERFNTWLEQELCPHLNADHVVIMDNARYHKTERTKELIEKTGAELLYLPPYSPDYNPIEHDFANIKRLRQYNSDIPLNEVINMYH